MAAGDGFRRCLFAAAVAAVLSSAVGFWALGYLRGEYRAANAAMRESAALRAAAEAREAELARYKKLLNGGSAKTPSRPESANKFYAALLAAVAESGMEERASQALPNETRRRSSRYPGVLITAGCGVF